ncbi:30S ribosomal protein S6 [Candidatus Gracilibacteria bacterium]|nr:30S ribosomal protein S6 [Candidatus Gracilibacteria bacterium]MCF7898844.1 30S ribosomal protein S6 [Candidatus Paceibacterota bacterium]
MTDINEITVDSRVYEVSFIFDNKLDEGAALEKSNAIKQSIATLGGSFISEEAPYMRELAYEMIRVVNNINVRFNEGYFGWIKFEMEGEKVKELEKGLKLDVEVVRYLVVRTVRENTVYTKRAPVIKVESLVNNETDDVVNIDTTSDDDIIADVVPEEVAEIVAEVVPDEITSEVTK